MNKKLLIFNVLWISLLSFSAIAGTGGAAFDSFYTEAAGWLDGAPGKILMVFMFLAAGYYGVVEPNFMRAAGGAVFGLVLANAQTLIDGFLTAGMGIGMII